MSEQLQRSRPFLILAAVILLAWAAVPAILPAPAAPARGGDDAAAWAQRLDAAAGRGFSFPAGTSPASVKLVTDAVAAARPEAQQLIDRVDGVTDVSFGPTGQSALGTTTMTGGRFRVVLDVDATYADGGARGITRLVLHEIAHVVDLALLDEELRGQLDAQIPAGYACAPGEPTGACAPVHERFAETFAKWATGDIGAALYLGYKVPPPSVTLDAWGAPLSQLAATA
ncbi:MAG TPA: hypothetical protein VM266_16615 [Solirubrobacteraceae bacterium]|nr:hypothetical protein [Solirubrobacteraceae bacterium]